MEGKVDARILKTREKLKKALLELMKEKRVRLEEDGTVRLTDRRQLSEEELARVDRQFSRQGESEEDDR